jgi:hypothetical protein
MNSSSSSISNRRSMCLRASDQALDRAATRYRPWRRPRSLATSGSSTMPSHIPASRAASWRSSRSSVSPTQSQNFGNDTDPTNAARSMGEPHTLRLKTPGSSPSFRSQRSSRNPVLVLVKTVFPKSNTTASITRHSRLADKSANATTPAAFESPRPLSGPVSDLHSARQGRLRHPADSASLHADRPIRAVIARLDRPAALPRDTSSRSATVRCRALRRRDGGRTPPCFASNARTAQGLVRSSLAIKRLGSPRLHRCYRSSSCSLMNATRTSGSSPTGALIG